MKLVQDKKSGTALRTSDRFAAQLVESGTHEYVAKSVWKEQRAQEQLRSMHPALSAREPGGQSQ